MTSNTPLSGAPPVRVWDLGIRIFHWSLLLAVLVAATTGFFGSPDAFSTHLMAGTAIACLLLFRGVWGFSGSTYARFRSFIFAPSVVMARARDMLGGRHVRYLGHNPLGSAMVFALLGTIVIILSTGAIALGGVLKQGPLAFVTSYPVGAAMKQVHQALAFALVALIILHLSGVIYESVVGQENLVRAMLTGNKAARSDVSPPSSARGRPVLALSLVGLIGITAAAGMAVLASRPGLGVPTAPVDAEYTKECGSCHFAYHPSMGTAQLWQGVLDNLADHFGEDAGLTDATRSRIGAYLAENSAEHWDTRIAHVLANPNPEAPLRFTATQFWAHRRGDVPEAVFKSKAVGFKGACDACHPDAKSGLFAPQAVAIPEGAFH
jgi:cytochrome b